MLIFPATSSLEICIRDDGGCSTHQLAQGFWKGPQPILHAGQVAVVSFQKSRRSASEGAFLAKGGPLAAVEGGWVDMILVWDTTVHRLAGHLLVPLPICASHGDAGLRLELDTRLQPPQPAKERPKLLKA